MTKEDKNAAEISGLKAFFQSLKDEVVNLRMDFKEAQVETKKYQERQNSATQQMSKTLDDLASKIMVFSGQMGSLAAMQRQINDNEKEFQKQLNYLKEKQRLDIEGFNKKFIFYRGIMYAVGGIITVFWTLTQFVLNPFFTAWFQRHI